MKASEATRTFSVAYGEHYNETLQINVKDGSIVAVITQTDHLIDDISTKSVYTPKNRSKKDYERRVKSAIGMIYRKSKDVYKELVEALNGEMLEKYFEPFYIPKD